MKRIIATLASLFMFSAASSGETEKLTDEVIPFAYETRAQIPTAEENLASLISIEYRRARDEFTKYELMEKIKPIIKTKLKKAKSNNQYLIRIESALGEYDFKEKTFPSGLSERTFIPFKNNYAVAFDNAKSIENIPVPYEEAKTLSQALQKSRRITALIYIDINGAKEKKLNYKHLKTLQTRITKVEFLTDKGRHISTMQL